MKAWSGCESVGIRFRKGDDFPYFVTEGFSEVFVQEENKLCTMGDQGRVVRDEQGIPVMACMCGNVIRGCYDGAQEFFTADGSFWTNSTTDFMARHQASVFTRGLRNHCNKMGYESLALVPLRSRETTYGLLQFCDRQKGRFSPERIAQFRWMADNIAMFLAKKEAEENIFRLNSRLERLTRVVQDLSLIADEQRICDIVGHAARELLESDRSSCILTMDVRGLSPDESLPLSWISDWVMNHGQAVDIGDLSREHPLTRGRDCPASVTSLLVMPIGRPDAMGALGVYWSGYHPPSNEDCQILQTLAEATLVALERIRVHRDFERSKQQYRNLVENLNDVVFYLDGKGRFQYISPAITDFGFSPDQLIGREFVSFAHPDDAEELKKMLAGTLSGYDESYECRALDKSGEIRYIRLSSRAVYQNGQAVGITGLMMDMTGKRRVEEQIKNAQRMEAIGTLAGGIAHDFNNILSSVIGFTELAMDEIDENTEVGIYLHEIFSAAGRARGLVKQILTFARQSDEKVTPIQVGPIAREAVKFIRSSTPSTISIHHDIKSEALIMGNATEVHQIFMNLLTNAIQAMEDRGGVLTVTLRETFVDEQDMDPAVNLKSGPTLVLTVSDTGVGMDPPMSNRIFQPYFTTRDVGQGSGMGLSIVHGIVERYGGVITVASAPGQGATFSVYLPITDSRVVDLLDRPPEPPPQGHERILFVDDEYAIARIGTQVLERLGYQVEMLTDSMDALMLFKDKAAEFDLVITDMTMPLMTGDTLAMEMIKIRNDIPIILCTGYNNKISPERARQIGIKAFAHKPVLKADIANVIRRVLDDAKGADHA
jgi:PAS domain S-box-containing protein